jgi:hypothetical protein
VTTPPSRLPQPWKGNEEVIWIVPLLCEEGGEEEPQVCFVATEDGCPTEADAMVLPLNPLSTCPSPPPPRTSPPTVKD